MVNSSIDKQPRSGHHAVAWSGIFTALVTPFVGDKNDVQKTSDDDYRAPAIDWESLERLVEYQCRARIHGLVVAGSTGEASALTDGEYRELLRVTLGLVRGRCPVVAGISVSDPRIALERAHTAHDLGVSGLLVTASPYCKPPLRAVRKYFELLHKSVQCPIVLYNIPSRVGISISPAIIADLWECGVIAAVKEASGSLDTFLQLRALTGGRLPILTGEDAHLLGVLACGGHGAISAAANVVPADLVAIFEAVRVGDLARAQDVFYRVLPVIMTLFSDTNPIVTKFALAEAQVISSAAVRLPLSELLPEVVAEVRDRLRTQHHDLFKSVP